MALPQIQIKIDQEKRWLQYPEQSVHSPEYHESNLQMLRLAEAKVQEELERRKQ